MDVGLYTRFTNNSSGDNLCMSYRPANNVRIMASSSFRDAILVHDNITEAEHARVRYWAERTVPPSAPNMRESRGNCQTWCLVVLDQLLSERIGRPDRVAEARRRQTPLPHQQVARPMIQPMEYQEPPISHQQSQGRTPKKKEEGCGCCIVM